MDEDVYVAELQFGPADEPYGTMFTTIPVQVLRGIEGKGGVAEEDDGREVKTLDRVMPIEMEVVAEMARLPMRVRDLKNLKVGDLIPLGPLTGVLMRINGKNVLVGEPGHANGQRSVRIMKRIQ